MRKITLKYFRSNIFSTLCITIISFILIGCSKSDEPDYNEPDYTEPEDPNETYDPYLIDGLRYRINDDNITCMVIGQMESEIPNHLVIPEEVEILGKKYTVTAISEDAYLGKKSVQISNTITSVGSDAIRRSVEQVIVGSNVNKIYRHSWFASKVIWLTNTTPTIEKDNAYYGTDISIYGNVNYTSTDILPVSEVVIENLSSLFWNDGILYTLLNPAERTCIAIGYDYAERNAIIIPDEFEKDGIQLKVAKIGPYLFAEAENLINVSGFKSIPEGMFYDCPNIESLVIDENVMEIGDNAFYGCKSLKLVKILEANDVLEIGKNSLGEKPIFSTTSLSEIYIGRKLDYNYSPFQNLTTLESVTISDIEKTIYDKEFYGCSGLKNISIGDGVTTIGSYAFSGCSSMESFTIGSGVSMIGNNAFSDCISLTSLTTEAIKPPTCRSQALDDIDKWKCKLYVPNESVEAYKAAPQWNNFLFVE